MAISGYFKRKEFACKCGCGFNVVDAELLMILELIRMELASPIIITSGCRCTKHNAKVGGAKNSKHTLGIAADIKSTKFSANIVADLIEKYFPEKYGLGKYDNWTHIDVREEKARWDNRK